MKLHHVPTLALSLTITLGLGLAGCSTESDPQASGSGTASGTGGGSSSGSADVMLAALPDGAMPVATAKPTVSEGDVVALRGRIGGNRAPMTAESGIFIIMDPALSPCPPDEGCPTPWDYCCETPESKSANNATVQLIGADGSPLSVDFAALGLEPMDEVVVVGTVGPRPNDQVLVVRATGVHKVAGS